MWIDLGIEDQYRIDGITDAHSFFRNLRFLLDEKDTLIVGSYGSRSDIAKWMGDRHLAEIEKKYRLRRRYDTYRAIYPEGKGYCMSATDEILAYLTRVSQEVTEPFEIGDHFAGVSAEHPLFILHDAFSGDPLYISGRIEEQSVRQFSDGMGLPYERIRFESGVGLLGQDD